MTLGEQLAKEIEDLPPESQEKVMRLIHFIKGRSFISPKGKTGARKSNALVDMDGIAIETGIRDLAEYHDHYTYGVPKK